MKRWLPLGLLAAGALLWVGYNFDPMSGEFPYPRCLFKAVTGWDCPGCGSARALHALLHGRAHEAWTANRALVAIVPLAAAGFVADRVDGRVRRIMFSPPAIGVLVAAIIFWTVLRNILCL